MNICGRDKNTWYRYGRRSMLVHICAIWSYIIVIGVLVGIHYFAILINVMASPKQPVQLRICAIFRWRWWDSMQNADIAGFCHFKILLYWLTRQRILKVMSLVDRYLWLVVVKGFQPRLESFHLSLVAGIDIPRQGVMTSYNIYNR